MIVCPDASLILKCLTYEPGTDAALAWLDAHRYDDMIVPAFSLAEIASVLRRKVVRREMTADDAQEALCALESMHMDPMSDFELIRRAFELAAELSLPTAYDTLYLAVAERANCDMWTADAKFAKAAARLSNRVRLLEF